MAEYGAYSLPGNQGRTGTTKTNQDSVFIANITPEGRTLLAKEQLKMNKDNPKSDWLVCAADGHGANGHFASQYIVKHLPKQFEKEKKRFATWTHGSGGSEQDLMTLKEQRIHNALVTSFLTVQQGLEEQQTFDCMLSGSTVVVAYLHEKTMYFANAGDSRGIVIGQTV